jgi:hypothetical protein
MMAKMDGSLGEPLDPAFTQWPSRAYCLAEPQRKAKMLKFGISLFFTEHSIKPAGAPAETVLPIIDTIGGMMAKVSG